MNQKSPAIFRASSVEEFARHTVRWTSIIVLIGSFVGSVMAFNGSWPATWKVWEHISLVALVGGIGVQVFCTLMEWANRKNRLSPRYIGPLLIDVGSTYIGFAPLLIPVLVRALSRTTMPASAAQVVAHVAVIVVAWWLAYYPETNLIRED